MLERKVIRELALAAGFDVCGVARAGALTDDAEFMRTWLAAGNHADMSYLERNFDKRTDPRFLVNGAQTVVVGLMSHYTDYAQPPGEKTVAKFRVLGVDYHKVVRKYLNLLESQLLVYYGADVVNADQQHSFCDTAPILERRWAERAGLGWIGKNKLLIHPQLGSFTNIGILLLNDECDEYDQPLESRCGACDRCLRTCPTGAISSGQMFDARKCISYMTTATKAPIPSEYADVTQNVAFGCDVCALNCPFNHSLIPHQNPDLFIKA